MLQDKKLIEKTLWLLGLLILPSLANAAGLFIELNDYVNKDINRIYINELGLRIENKREIKIVKLDSSKVIYVNPVNNTYSERSFNELDMINRIHKRYNDDSFADTSTRNNGVSIVSIKGIELKNRSYAGAIVKYKARPYNQILTILAAKAESSAWLKTLLASNLTLVRFLEYYLSKDETEILKAGYVPIRTSKLFELTKLFSASFDTKIFSVPVTFRKTNSGDYYKEMAIQMIGSAKRR
jgi:hypothetical protein